MDALYDELIALTRPFGQEHVLRFWDRIQNQERENLAREIRGLDLTLLHRLYQDLVRPTGHGHENAGSLPAIAPLRGKAWESLSIAERAAMANAGMRLLREGKAAAFLVAGGQGTRLGHPGPKGTFNLGLPSGKSLFQLQAERLWNLGRMAGRPIPWYIMTSSENHSATVDFFRDNASFGLDPSLVFFFQQDQMPVVDDSGRILLDGPSSISQGPNGNGGCFLGLDKSGALRDMRDKGVEWVFTYSVDNALVKVCDPHFLGFAAASGFPSASKAVQKTNPEERVGVFCLREGRPSVIEYSELDAENRRARDGAGQLLFGAGNIAIHLFHREFLEREAASPLPYHAAHKRIPHIGKDGESIEPVSPNAWKFELFMFDLFPRSEGMAVMEVLREEEFAPVKNKEGEDSPATARALINRLHRRWAMSAGCDASAMEKSHVEISPKVSYAGEGLSRVQIQASLGADGIYRLEGPV